MFCGVRFTVFGFSVFGIGASSSRLYLALEGLLLVCSGLVIRLRGARHSAFGAVWV